LEPCSEHCVPLFEDIKSVAPRMLFLYNQVTKWL
jgi:hypothetical protein